MKEIDLLFERAEKYLQSATILLGAKDFESTVSRVYYAMFFSTEALLLARGLTFTSHKGVISAFGENFVKTDIFPKEMSKELIRAFEKRQLCDYEFEFIITEGEAVEILKSGKNFVTKIKNFMKVG